MYTVYILLCDDNTLYTGITTNIERRFQEHKEGKGSKYTRSRNVLKVVYLEKCRSKSRAMRREIAIKRLTKKQKLSLIS